MNVGQVRTAITELILKIHPDCFLEISESHLGPRASLVIHFATSKKWPNNIMHNDPGHTQIWLHDMFDEVTGERCKDFTIDSGMYGYHNHKTGLNNTCKFHKINKPCDFEKFKRALTTYFTEMRACVDFDNAQIWGCSK